MQVRRQSIRLQRLAHLKQSADAPLWCRAPAPEVLLQKPHGKPVDLWSVGVITYTLLCGYIPFRSHDTQQLIEECKAAKLEFHDKYWKNVSDEAKAFIRALVKPNPGDRPTVEQALKHKWLVDALKKVHEHDLSVGFKANWCAALLLS